MKYLIIVEKTETGFSAYSPDVDGCIATGKTKQDVENNIQEAMEFHFEGLLLEKQEIPCSHTYSNYVEIKATA
ncbi:MAG: type II toxin-antitoxin system HicB family antitoxin [Deltaproteobacteria bacterium]|nr:MAG: type II toxin-antitoxin system HicB family antitoxin [Deltaproteobacteria bacterium]